MTPLIGKALVTSLAPEPNPRPEPEGRNKTVMPIDVMGPEETLRGGE